MSWLFDEDGALINLDKVEMLEIREVEESPDGATHCLAAHFASDDPDAIRWITRGSEQHCSDVLIAIVSKIHIIKVNPHG